MCTSRSFKVPKGKGKGKGKGKSKGRVNAIISGEEEVSTFWVEGDTWYEYNGDYNSWDVVGNAECVVEDNLNQASYEEAMVLELSAPPSISQIPLAPPTINAATSGPDPMTASAQANAAGATAPVAAQMAPMYHNAHRLFEGRIASMNEQTPVGFNQTTSVRPRDAPVETPVETFARTFETSARSDETPDELTHTQTPAATSKPAKTVFR